MSETRTGEYQIKDKARTGEYQIKDKARTGENQIKDKAPKRAATKRAATQKEFSDALTASLNQAHEAGNDMAEEGRKHPREESDDDENDEAEDQMTSKSKTKHRKTNKDKTIPEGSKASIAYLNDGLTHRFTQEQESRVNVTIKTVTKTKKTKSKDLEPAIKVVKKSPFQMTIDNIQAEINEATPGFAMINVMDDNDFNWGPLMETQKINTQTVDWTFVKQLVVDTKKHGLLNRHTEHAIIIGVRQSLIVPSSLEHLRLGQYINNVEWTEEGRALEVVLKESEKQVKEHGSWIAKFVDQGNQK
ncbi:uncharacterized protein EDB91DRAFT_1083774 [Suillus paluster]|uniref:uncharacterized protein n=1 Tax=Suillus paluster TaxID=48578 RepID=UPI001B868C71|nr:uncharacterized protein EDB91DRAFT_1083774 [Suillus paluster]KAG1735320.1 hypothetical protein EDB91DRAFT_1083774 [Suillus paluster]